MKESENMSSCSGPNGEAFCNRKWVDGDNATADGTAISCPRCIAMLSELL